MSSKNILIITENYTFGGLETHLYGKIKHLSDNGYNVFLATGTLFLENNLPYDICKKIFFGLDLLASATSQSVVSTIQKLANIIEENNIDIVDAHPHFSVLPAFFSASLTKRPFVYTIHGPGSILEEYGVLTEWFSKYILLANSSLISNVSEEVFQLTKNYVPSSRNHIFRNAVDMNVFQPADKMEKNYTKSCIVSRLDTAKVNGIKEFIKLASLTDIKEVDVFGEGPESDNLRKWITETNLNSQLQVQLKGVCLNMQDAYKDYSIVAGMGRVTLEALALNIPVILVGYDGVKGLLDEQLINKASYANFSGRGVQNINADQLNEQLRALRTDDTPFRLTSWVNKNANEKNVWAEFIKQLEEVKSISSELIFDVYQCFLNHKSDLPYILDYVLVAKVQRILRSNAYINTNAYRFMVDHDHRIVLEGVNEIKMSLSTHFNTAPTIAPAYASTTGISIDEYESIIEGKNKEIELLKMEKQNEVKNTAELIHSQQQKYLALENQLFALSLLISTKTDMPKVSFKKGILDFFESGIASPMFKTYVEYALTSIDRGQNIVAQYKNLMRDNFEYLDIGCAYGGSVISMVKAGAKRAVGVDVDQRLLELAKLQAVDYGVSNKTTFIYTDIQDPDKVTSLGTFDLITCIDVLEHVIKPEEALTSLSKLGNKNSVLIVDIPNPYSPFWIKKDPHHHLFGTVLLERDDAVKQFFHHYPASQEYLVGFFNDFEWYKRVFNSVGFSIHVLNETSGSTEEWTNLKYEANSLMEYAQTLSTDDEWPDWLKEKVFSRLQWYLDEMNNDEIKYKDDIKYLCNKYGISVYHLKCIKNK